ncbi:hypothetical protein [Coleofasciculus sp. E1-EBD-02]|uniref:hypothetical protein n=1 Tax=Coleofasciculus sp. E1-EBD-02 TaxID=3068481 RepID=UPI0032F1C893
MTGVPITYQQNPPSCRFDSGEAGEMVTIALTDYPLPPVDQILGFLIWMIRDG